MVHISAKHSTVTNSSMLFYQITASLINSKLMTIISLNWSSLKLSKVKNKTEDNKFSQFSLANKFWSYHHD